MKKITTLLLGAFMLFATAAPSARAQEDPPPGQIGVAPSMIEVSVGSKPVNESLRLFNLKDKPTKVKVEVYNWTLDANNEVKLLPPTEQSLDQWMLVNPMSFRLEPGKSQVVRLSIRPPVKPAPGEHRAIIYFTEEAIEENAVAEEAKPVEILFKLGVGVYAYADPVKRAGTLQGLTLGKGGTSLTASIANSGNVHTRLKGTYSVWKKASFPGIGSAAKAAQESGGAKPAEGLVASGQLNQTPVLPGGTRNIVTQLPNLPSGSYILAVSGALDEQKIEKTFTLSR